MKNIFRIALTVMALCCLGFAQQFVQQSAVPLTATGVSGPVLENGGANIHTLIWTTTGSPTGCTIQLENSSTGASFSLAGTAQTCTSSGTYTLSGTTANFWHVNLATLSGGTNPTVSFTYFGYPPITGNFTDGVANLPPSTCTISVPTTGVFAANPANSGTYVGPAMVRVAAGETVLQATTTAAASALVVDCDLTPPTRTTSGKGVTVTGYQLWYAVQTTALTSITAPVVNTVTFPATGGTAAGTVASAGGSLTILPASLILTTSTSGACQSANVSFGTPVVLNTINQRLGTTWVFNQTGASAEVLQICGVQVFFNNNPL